MDTLTSSETLNQINSLLPGDIATHGFQHMVADLL
jgi:hypothetical protein